MSDLDALAQKLMNLISDDAEFDGDARVISHDGTPAPLAAIIDEIDDTVLDRTLEFVGGESTVSLIAGGRRLRGILAMSPDGDDDVVGQTLSREDPALIQAAGTALSQRLGSAERVTVRSLALEPFGSDGAERGVSASRLAELWEQPEDDDDNEDEDEPKSPMERFLRANAKAMSSLMHVNKGEIMSTSGDFAALQAMWNNQVMEFRKTNKDMLTGKKGPQLICLEGALNDGSAAALVIAENEIALMAYNPKKLSAMQSSWRRIFG